MHVNLCMYSYYCYLALLINHVVLGDLIVSSTTSPVLIGFTMGPSRIARHRPAWKKHRKSVGNGFQRFNLADDIKVRAHPYNLSMRTVNRKRSGTWVSENLKTAEHLERLVLEQPLTIFPKVNTIKRTKLTSQLLTTSQTLSAFLLKSRYSKTVQPFVFR